MPLRPGRSRPGRQAAALLVILAAGALLSACHSAPPAAAPTHTPYPFVTATTRPSPTPVTPTPEPPTHTPTPTPTPTFTSTPSATEPLTGSPSPSPTPSATSGPVACPEQPPGTLRQITAANPDLAEALGCVIAPDAGTAPREWPVVVRYQPMERGHLLWVSSVGWYEGRVVYVLFDDGTYNRYDDTYQAGMDRAGGGPDAPEGLFQPQESLGKVWRLIPGLIARIGFGTAPPAESQAVMQLYQYGELITVLPAGAVFAFRRGVPSTWTVYPLPN